MRIGMIGAGNVGAALGRAFERQGHDVMFGVRDAASQKTHALLESVGAGATAGPVPNAASWGDVLVLAIPWDAVPDALEQTGEMDGKVLLDATNPLAPDLSGLTVGHTTSAAEQIADRASEARVVKIFNTIGASNMENPIFDGAPATMLYCGDDADAKQVAALLASEIGFDPVDAGPLTAARLLEPLALLWIQLAYAQNLGRDFAFTIVRR